MVTPVRTNFIFNFTLNQLAVAFLSECPVGKHGLECAHICSTHCAGPTNACDHVDGSCDQGCDAGYKGQLCTEGMCTLIFYGGELREIF